MQRRRVAWTLAVAPALGGWYVAHAFAHTVAPPDSAIHERLHDGPTYLGLAPFCIAACVMLVLAAVAVVSIETVRAPRRGRAAMALFGLLPPLGFVVQDAVERTLLGSGWTADAVLEPTFVAAIAMQVPFALAAVAVAYLLVAAASAVRDALAYRDVPRVVMHVLLRWPAHTPDAVPAAAFALGHGQRAPPLPLRS